MRILIVLLLMATYAVGSPICKVDTSRVTATDTSMTVSWSSSAFICFTTKKTRGLLETEGAYPACMEKLKKSEELVGALTKSNTLQEEARADLHGAVKALKESVEGYKGAAQKFDTLAIRQDSLRKEALRDLEKCQEDTPSWEVRIYQMLGTMLVGIVLGIALSR